jgi:hypothetical protein
MAYFAVFLQNNDSSTIKQRRNRQKQQKSNICKCQKKANYLPIKQKTLSGIIVRAE